MSPPETPLRLSVNGCVHSLDCGPRETLLGVLRDRLELMGTKSGCGIGYCGACTVLVDGQVAHSCCLLAATLDNCEIVTIEGLSDDRKLNPVQEAFLEAGAVQCGYCVPGLVMTIQGLLEVVPDPDETLIRKYLIGNMCRCSGYASVVRAALAAASPSRSR